MEKTQNLYKDQYSTNMKLDKNETISTSEIQKYVEINKEGTDNTNNKMRLYSVTS